MKRLVSIAVALVVVLAAMPAARGWAQRGNFLSDDEEDALREAQDPGKRIEVYLGLEQVRLGRMDSLQDEPAQLNLLLNEYVSLTDEMKDWIEYQYGRHGDMRQGLRAFLERGPQQLERLRQIRQRPGADSAVYADNLRDAIDSVTDALEGSTRVLAEQQKMFGQLQREQKAEARAAKERIKEEKKRNQEEKKLRERMQRRSKSDSDSKEN